MIIMTTMRSPRVSRRTNLQMKQKIPMTTKSKSRKEQRNLLLTRRPQRPNLAMEQRELPMNLRKQEKKLQKLQETILILQQQGKEAQQQQWHHQSRHFHLTTSSISAKPFQAPKGGQLV